MKYSINHFLFSPATHKITSSRMIRNIFGSALFFIVASCAPMNVPGGRTVDIPPATKVAPRAEALNEGRDSILTIPLGVDVLVPQTKKAEKLPDTLIGPYELRAETLASALQLVLADYEIPIAFQTNEGLTRQITVTNLKGTVDDVVIRLCGLANLYCTYEKGILEVKDTETFTVSLPPLDDAGFASISTGLQAVSGATTVIDPSTRTLIYTITQRDADKAEKYFDRLRANTAMIVYETYIWEVQLNSTNSAGIRWENIDKIGKFNTGISIADGVSSQVGTPITIGLPTRGNVNFTTGDILSFLTEQGAVKTISQPQITVLSGSSASLSVVEKINFVESLSRSTDDNGDVTVSTTTGEVDSGFTLDIASSWDQSTVYATVELQLDEFLGFQEFDAGSEDTLQLPRTSERELITQVRSRPGDSILIAGLVRETDEYTTAGLGTSSPIIPTSRTGSTNNSELVILLRPRVIRYLSQEQIEAEKNNFSLFQSQSSGNPLDFLYPKSTMKQKDIDIDLLLNPSIEITPMEISK